MSSAWGAAHARRVPPICPARATPRIRLFTERLTIDAGAYGADYRELDAPAIELSFDYAGALVRASEPGTMVLATSGLFARDLRAEAHARYVLESFGAVELDCLEDYAVAPDSDADYLVMLEGDTDAQCSFTAYAVPQLRALGWRVDIADDYPYQVVEAGPWYADITADDEQDGDWFSLELGVVIDGQTVNLVPALLELVERAPSLHALAKTHRKCIAVPIGENRYLPVPPARLRTVLEVIRELYKQGSGNGSLRFPEAQAATLAYLGAAFDAEQRLEWRGDTAVRDRGYDLAIGPSVDMVAAPAGLRATLRPYQREGLSWLQHLRRHDAGGILADDMGLGKTLQTIAHLTAEVESGRAQTPSLVIAPTSLVFNWQREIAKFAPDLRTVVLHGASRHALWERVDAAHVVVTTYGVLVRDLEQLQARSFHLLILDEAQAIKNSRGRAHKAIKQLDAAYRLCLSGTPVENNLGELWSLFDFLMPSLLGNAESFRARFRNPIERLGDERRLEALRERVAPFILRRTKDQVAPDLPPKTEIVRPVDLTGAQRELYESIRVAAHARVRRAIQDKGVAGSTIAILDALMKLRQVCCDPAIANVGAARKVDRSAKRELLFEMLEQQLGQGRRILVFSQFTSMLSRIGQSLSDRRIGYVSLTGATPNRQKPIDAFEGGEVDVFLISLKAGGTGLNLTSADTVIHYDPWWNPAAQDQATDRAYRIGQTKPVFVYNLIVAGSVEERMLQLQRKKRYLADSLLAPGGGARMDLSESEVEDLFAPLEPTA
jgi:SNF2 family DNA or RNA helicase